MKVAVYILGIIQITAGILILFGSVSAIHEILSAVLFGMGSICLALGGILSHLEQLSSSRTSMSKDVHETKNLMHINNDSKNGWKTHQ